MGVGGVERDQSLLVLHLCIYEGEKNCWESQNTQKHIRIMSKGIKDKHVLKRTISLSTERNLGGGLQRTVGLLTAAITLNQMFWH